MSAQNRTQVSAAVLAAGRSSRMGGLNKLLEILDGKPIILHVLDTLFQAGLEDVVVVLGHEADRVGEALASLPVRRVDNPDHARGMATSLRVALRATHPSARGLLVCLGDMPWVRPGDLKRIVAGFEPERGRSACVPVHDGRRGNPVLIGRDHFESLFELEGDAGARAWLREQADHVVEVPIDHPGVLRDVDTPEALERARGRRPGPPAEEHGQRAGGNPE